MAKLSNVGIAAAKNSREQFAERLSSYTNLTAEEVAKLFPKKSDREELIELMKIVNSAATENQKKARIVKHIGKVSGAVVKVVKKFARV
jgi:hypothetical protein